MVSHFKKFGLLYFCFFLSACQNVDPVKRLLHESDNHGRVIFHKETGKQVYKWPLRHNYGLKVVHESGLLFDTVIYYFISQKEKMEYKTYDLNTLLKLIKKKVPSGEIIDNYNPCANGWHNELDQSILEKIRIFCKKNNIVYHDSVDDSNTILCTCGINGP